MSTTGRDNRIVLELVKVMFGAVLVVLPLLAIAYNVLGRPGWIGVVAVVVAGFVLLLAVCVVRVALRD